MRPSATASSTPWLFHGYPPPPIGTSSDHAGTNRHCEFRTGLRPVPLDEPGDICPPPSWSGISPSKDGRSPERPMSRPSTSSNGAAVSYPVGALSAKHLGRVQAEPHG